MRWYYIDVYAESELCLVEKVSSLGLTGVGLPGKGKAHLRVYFKRLDEREKFRKELEKEFEVELGEEEDKDWICEVERGYEPVRVSRFVIVPSRLIPILIKPGMAFGTGYHPSTRIALRLIDEMVNLKDGLSLDLGTGSGILAVALYKKGVRNVIALDKDAVALREAKENLIKNGVKGGAYVIGGDLLSPFKRSVKFDIVVANLLFPIFEAALSDIADHMKKGGLFIASGITLSEKERFLALLGEEGFKLVKLVEEEDWVGTAAVLC